MRSLKNPERAVERACQPRTTGCSPNGQRRQLVSQKPVNPRDAHATPSEIRPSDAGDARLMHLSDMDDFEIAEGEPDIDGWDVRTTDGRKIGQVDDLLVDASLMKVRYIEVKVDDEYSENHDVRDYLLIPVGAARLDDEADDVIVSLESTQIGRLPRYERRDLTREYEESLLTGFGRSGDLVSAGGDFYTGDHFHEHRLLAARRRHAGDMRDDASYLRRTIQ
jgi:sporulation protein YlmC with PRC-barrel domain